MSYLTVIRSHDRKVAINYYYYYCGQTVAHLSNCWALVTLMFLYWLTRSL